MIAKRIARDKATSNFGRLGRYILEARNNEAEILWTRTAEYILDAKGSGEKVAWSRLTNCQAEVPGLAIAEIQATQAKNKRAQSDKTYHLVISFREGEKPNREQLEDIEDRICEGLGYADHQRISAVHQDTENVHIHIAVNKIHPESLRCVEPYYDHYKLNELCRELEIKHGLEQDNRIEHTRVSGRAGDMEAHAGEESLLRWIKENALPSVLEGLAKDQSWQSLHASLARYGLEIKPRGAGLVIAVQGERLAIKASSMDRSLAFKALTDLLGAYEPPFEIQPVQVEATYQKRPRHAQGKVSSLYAEFQKQRETVFQSREYALSSLKTEHEHYLKELNGWHDARYQAIKGDLLLSGKEKREACKKLSEQRQNDLQKQKKLVSEQRKAITKQYPLLSWPEFLQVEAQQGNSQALADLRNLQNRRKRISTNILTAENVDQARHIVFEHLQPQVRRTGDTLYRVADGGQVLDETHQVRVPGVTVGAAFLALVLANERFKGKPLVVEGNDEFKRQLVQLAGKPGMNIFFADSELEQSRLYALKDSKTLEAEISFQTGGV